MAERPGRSAARLALFEHYRARGTTAWIAAEGSSMLPAIPSGAWLLVEFGARDQRVGEVVVVPRGDRLISHRVVRRTGTPTGVVLVTKGDARRYFDPPIAAGEVLGVVRGVRRTRHGRIRRGLCSGVRGAVVARISSSSGRLAASASRARCGRAG